MGLPVNEIICGDCLEVMKDWPDNCVDLVLTDPPYMISAASKGSGVGKLNLWADLCNAARFFGPVLAECMRVLKPTGGMWQFLNWKTLVALQKASFDVGVKIESLLVWDKIWIGPGGMTGLRPSYELVSLFANESFKIPNRGIPDIYSCLWSSRKPTGHPAEKPVKLLEWLIEISTKPNDIILDPFIGSGSTAVAAIQQKRQFVGIEMNEYWVEQSNKRIEAVDTGVPVKEQNKGQMALNY